MRQAVWAASALVVGMLLAVALMPREGTPDALDAGSFSGDGPAARASEAPEWRVGDAWRVQFGEGDPICWLVVAREVEAILQQGVWCESGEAELIATQIAVLDLPYVGAFTREIEGVTSESETRWYDWPLADGKSWETDYRGEAVVVSVQETDEGRFVMSMDRANGPLATYDYDPDLLWWSNISFESGYTLRVIERETGWSRSTALASANDASTTWSEFVTAPLVAFTADEEDDFVVMVAQRPTNAVAYYELTAPDGSAEESAVKVYHPLLAEPTYVYEAMPAQPGGWTYREVGVGAGLFELAFYTAKVETVEL